MPRPTINQPTRSHLRLKSFAITLGVLILILSGLTLAPETGWPTRLRFIETGQAAFAIDLENVALAASGATASASSTYASYSFSQGAVIDGDRRA